MKIQLLKGNNNVIYEQEKSDIFPDYRSVLLKAISLKIDLTGLCIDSQLLDNIHWSGINLSNISFNNCLVKNNLYINCNLHKASFRKCKISHTSFNSTNLTETFFFDCSLSEITFVHLDKNNDWYKDLGFVRCSLDECIFDRDIVFSQLYIVETEIDEYDLRCSEIFTEVRNKNSKVHYAVISDVVWWKPYSWDDDERKIFRGSLKDLIHEVENEFPTTDLYPDQIDYAIENELSHVIEYLLSWKNPK